MTALAILGAVIVLAAFVSRRDDGVPVRTAVVEQSDDSQHGFHQRKN